MKKIYFLAFLTLSFLSLFFIPYASEGAASANLNQGRNGTDAAPTTPMNWVNGNLSGSQAHYLEGMSAPFQCVMTGLTSGASVTIIIGYDIKSSNKNSYDYLTYYSRITPHGFALHTVAETLDMLSGTGLPASTPYTNYTVPAPSTLNSPVAGQPANSCNALPNAERKMTLFNGTIDSIYYVVQGDLTANQSETQVAVKFTPSAATSVLAWGGHIASRNDWGYVTGSPRSAGGISGSPFHMRLISWTYGSIGSQDRGLAGGSVFAPPMPLPVELIHFSAQAEKNKNILQWTTASEINNDFFSIQRSSGITHFEAIARVEGSGSTSAVHNYQWVDENPLPGLNYYRLVQTDYDGTQKIYGPVSVMAGGKQAALSQFKVFSNLSEGEMFLSFFTPSRDVVQVSIFTITGELVQTGSVEPADGMNFTVIRCDSESPGIYFVRLSQGDAMSKTERIVLN